LRGNDKGLVKSFTEEVNMLDYAQLLGMNGGNAQAATLMQNALQPGVSLLNDAGPTPIGQNPMTGGPSRFSMGTAIGQAGQAGTLMGQANQQVAKILQEFVGKKIIKA
jgi:hypothetical protein